MKQCYFCRKDVKDGVWACKDCNSDEAFKRRQVESRDQPVTGIIKNSSMYGSNYQTHLQKRAKLTALHQQGKLPKHMYSMKNGKPYLSPQKLRTMSELN